ncbi:c-type cytochrome [Limnohabitans sp. Rim8]|jgi:cytochrome c553|uniref:c-type cytochrome n=1 Tax=Limnohabitans sp. Rim8 TaxID=1100718 RepID=UPI0025D66CD3|nr:c-type cytochrome [Limnohabitans sp. Rim8]
MNKLLTSMFALAVASVTAISAHAQEIKGDAKAAEQKIAMCIGCHGIKGYQASFPEVYRVPMISGQNAKYIVSALNAYKKGERKHPTMRGIADTLTDQDMADLGAYYEQHGKTEAVSKAPAAPDAKVAALLQKGACISCHGENFSKPVDPSYPKIAGQHKDFLFVALKSYKVENQSTWGRNNGVMGGIAKQYSNAELKAIAGYIGSLEGDMKVVPQSRFR